jgi:hypothetical protein
VAYTLIFISTHIWLKYTFKYLKEMLFITSLDYSHFRTAAESAIISWVPDEMIQL